MIRRSLVALFALVVASYAPLTAQDPAARVDELMAEYGSDGPGAVIGVVHDGEVVFAKAYGLANLEHGIPLTRESVLDIGSVAKQFTGFAVALLADRGELSLDDDIRTHLPDVPDFGPTVTIRHLLHHTSGLREIYTANSMAGWRGGDGLVQSDALDLIRHTTELNFEPGDRYLYCNTAYMLLADIVAEVSGVSFPEFMADNVFGPLGMEHTTIMDVQGKVIRGAADSYGGSGDPDYRKIFDNSSIMGAGGIYTTAADLLAWVANLGTGEVGGPAVLETHRTRGILNDGDTLSYAMGIGVGEWRGQPRLSHGGSSAGYRATMAFFPDLDAGVVTLSNYAGFDGDIANGVVEAFFGERLAAEEEDPDAAEVEPVAPDEPAAVGADVLDGYVGVYELSNGATLTVTREDTQLYGRPIGQPRVALTPWSETTFTAAGLATVVFHREDDAPAHRITMWQGGQSRGLTRVEDPWEPSAAELEALAGRYYSPELETVYTIEVREGRLRARHRRHGEFPLATARMDVLRGPGFFGEARVQRDSAGRVIGLRVDNGRVLNLWFERMR